MEPIVLQGIRIRGSDLAAIWAETVLAPNVDQELAAPLFMAWLESIKIELERIDLALDGKIAPVIQSDGQIDWRPIKPEYLESLRKTDAFRLSPNDLRNLAPPSLEAPAASQPEASQP